MPAEQHFFPYDKLGELENQAHLEAQTKQRKERHESIDEDAVIEFLKIEILKGLVNGARQAQTKEIDDLTTSQLVDLYKNDFGDEFDMEILLSGQDCYKKRLGLQKNIDLDQYQKKAWEKIVRRFAAKYKFDLVEFFSFPEPLE